jgi:hypothetical protein
MEHISQFYLSLLCLILFMALHPQPSGGGSGLSSPGLPWPHSFQFMSSPDPSSALLGIQEWTHPAGYGMVVLLPGF